MRQEETVQRHDLHALFRCTEGESDNLDQQQGTDSTSHGTPYDTLEAIERADYQACQRS